MGRWWTLSAGRSRRRLVDLVYLDPGRWLPPARGCPCSKRCALFISLVAFLGPCHQNDVVSSTECILFQSSMRSNSNRKKSNWVQVELDLAGVMVSELLPPAELVRLMWAIGYLGAGVFKQVCAGGVARGGEGRGAGVFKQVYARGARKVW